MCRFDVIFTLLQVGPAAAEALVSLLAATLQEVSVFSVPAALQQCRSLRRLVVRPCQPCPSAEQQRLCTLLRDNKALEQLSFQE